MLKRINWKAIFKGFAWLVSLAGVVVLMSFIEAKKQTVKCTNVKILIPGADNFIEREEIDAILRQGQGQLIGRNLDQININEIEKTLKSNPYIAFAKVYTDMDGVIHVEVKQRQPVLRILNAGGQDYYIDSDGLKMPMSPNFTADVLVATGNILEGFSGKIDTLLTPLATDLYKTALFLKKDTLWDAQIEQMYVNERNDIELVPRVGNQRIILGNADSIATKMNNLLAFYKQAMPTVGWNAYRTINLKYTNQIVCEKLDSLGFHRPLPSLPLDSAAVIKSTTDSLVKSAIQDEINAAAASQDKPAVPKTPVVKDTKPSAAAPKETDKPVVKPVTNTAAKPSATTSAKTPAVTPPKTGSTPTVKVNVPQNTTAKPKTPAVTKEKTDTKKL